MFSLPVGRSRLRSPLALALVLGPALCLSAREDSRSKQQMEWMRAAVGSLEPESSELKKAALTFADKPLLRYSDPTRGGVNEAGPTCCSTPRSGAWGPRAGRPPW